MAVWGRAVWGVCMGYGSMGCAICGVQYGVWQYVVYMGYTCSSQTECVHFPKIVCD